MLNTRREVSYAAYDISSLTFGSDILGPLTQNAQELLDEGWTISEHISVGNWLVVLFSRELVEEAST